MSSFNASSDLMVEHDTGLDSDAGLDGGDAEAGMAGGDGPTARRRGTKPGTKRGRTNNHVQTYFAGCLEERDLPMGV